mgnify:FL=1|jgi:hypothetical protein|tara:strand:+ start:96 stop:368 length:273 start_codon:yes stop_codon:yes gene_type:complete
MPRLTNQLFKSNRIKTYSVKEHVLDDRKNAPNNFRENILTNSISKHIIRNNQMYDFIQFIQVVISNWVDSVTSLKVFKSFTVKKDYKNVR